MSPKRGVGSGRSFLPLSPWFASGALVLVTASVSWDVQAGILYAEENSITFTFITGSIPILEHVKLETGKSSALFAPIPWADKSEFYVWNNTSQ